MKNRFNLPVSIYRLKKMVFDGYMSKVMGLCPVLTAAEVKTFVDTFSTNYSDFVSANTLDLKSGYTPQITALVEQADTNWIALQKVVDGFCYYPQADCSNAGKSIKSILDMYGRVDLLANYAKFASIHDVLTAIDALDGTPANLLGIDETLIKSLQSAYSGYIALAQARDDERQAYGKRKTYTRAALSKSFTQLADFVSLMADNGGDDCYTEFINKVNAIDLFRYASKSDGIADTESGDTAEDSADSAVADGTSAATVSTDGTSVEASAETSGC